MRKVDTELNDKSKVGFSLLIPLFGMIVSVMIWLNATVTDVAVAKNDIVSLKEEKAETKQILRSIDNRLRNIERELRIKNPGEE